MSDTFPEQADLLRSPLGLPPGVEPSAECLDDDAIAALAEESFEPSRRAPLVSHLATCSRCRAAVASVAAALADSALAAEVASLEAPGRRRMYRYVVPAAAAAIVLILVVPRWVGDRPPTHRAPTITAGTSPTPISPVGSVAQARSLTWSAVAGADRYRVTLFDAGGRVIYDAELPDTVTPVPDSVRLAPGQRYLWKVEARVGFDRWSSSELIEFSTGEGRPR